MGALCNFTFKTPRGEQITDWVWFNRDDYATWISYSAWIGATPSGSTRLVNEYWGPTAVYMMDGPKIVALVQGIATRASPDVGKTGSGKLYRGTSGLYASPIDFTWECVPPK
jgi:hypothetical protein